MAEQQQRSIGVAMDFSPASKHCLAWTLDHLARNGDKIFLVFVRKKEGELHLFEQSGSPLIPLDENEDENVLDKYEMQPDPQLLALIRQSRDTKQVSAAAKVYYGDPGDKILEAVHDLRLDMLAVGSRGLGAVKRALVGSVSNHVINHATCPVTVVKMPEASAARS